MPALDDDQRTLLLDFWLPDGHSGWWAPERTLLELRELELMTDAGGWWALTAAGAETARRLSLLEQARDAQPAMRLAREQREPEGDAGRAPRFHSDQRRPA